MGKHTPGPWKPFFEHPGQWSIIPEKNAKFPENWTIAYIRDFQKEDKENAILLASSPELLEALKDAICLVETKTDTYKKWHALIAKAEGRE